jgi:hypothetical protein
MVSQVYSYQMKTLLLLILIIGVGCDKPTPTAQAAPKSTEPKSLDEALGLTAPNRIMFPANDKGVYLVTPEGVWLLAGDEAVRVREVPKFSPGS